MGTVVLVGLPALAAVTVAVTVAVIILVRRGYAEVSISGSSMEPAYRPGDRVLVRRVRPAQIQVGAVVVIERPDAARGAPPPRGRLDDRKWLIKRVLAVPGDPVPRDRVPSLAGVPERHVPPGKLVLLGDAPRGSYDSRQLGYFLLSHVLGVVTGDPRR